MSDAVVVIGGGTMGVGIAEVLLDAGADVTVVEPNEAVADRVRDRLGDRAGLTVTDAVASPIEPVLVVEAVPEDLALKQRVLPGIEGFVPPDCVIASNTSSLSIDAIATSLARPERFIGMHFFNPVPKSLLVELVVGQATDPTTTTQAADWVQRLGKEHIEVRDSPGFATSRLGLAIGLEAIRMVEDGVASAEDIDRGMVLGYKFPTGPLKLTDLVGLDVRLAIAEHLARELGPRFEPPELLRRKVANGELGKKSGKGFYEWS
ncbi:MAG: 3-hydroxyacyl-CoA dehydrogenase family protein [Acidimicrobiia bacterium]